MAYPKHFKLLFCALGIFVCYFHFGILQEKITRGKYGDEKDCEKFTYMFSLVFFQCLVNYLFAKTSLLTIMKQGEDSTPKTYYILSALTYLLAMVCSNMALQFVSYPTQVIAKSGKPVPVMILGVLLGKKVFCIFLIYVLFPRFSISHLHKFPLRNVTRKGYPDAISVQLYPVSKPIDSYRFLSIKTYYLCSIST